MANLRAERWQGHHCKRYARMTKRGHKEDKYVVMKRAQRGKYMFTKRRHKGYNLSPLLSPSLHLHLSPILSLNSTEPST